MQGLDAASSALNALLSIVVVAGLVLRGRLSSARLFSAYLVFGIVARLLAWAAPHIFYTGAAWLIADGLHIILRFGVAGELLWACYGRLAGGERGARLLLVSAVVLVFAAALLRPDTAPAQYGSLYPAWLRLSQAGYALGLAFVAVLAVTVRAGLPVDPLHRSIAAGMAVYCLLHALRPLWVQLDVLLPLGRGALMKIAYPTILAGWAHPAWRREEVSGLSPAALRMLQPWRRLA